MRFIGLISGGKDSLHNLLVSTLFNHTPVCLGHLTKPHETDSYMY